MRKVAITAAIILIGLGLAGCNHGAAGYSDEGWGVEVVETPSGSVTCVLFDGFDADSISCDWNNARR